MAARHQVGPDTVVHFSYRLFDEEGELVEESDPKVPLSFLYGYGQLSPLLESSLLGLFAGDRRRTTLPKDAFGLRDPEAIIEVARHELPENASVGDEFEAEHESAGAVSLVVLELTDEFAVLDANHPLASQAADIEVVVDAVRPALAVEVALAVEELEASPEPTDRLLPGSRLLQRPTTVPATDLLSDCSAASGDGTFSSDSEPR
jgi:FKBP-type peptidyl-prolyl cis-trans isomerase 2